MATPLIRASTTPIAAATQCFHTAAALFTPAIEVVEIPYEDTVLHGYFYRAAGSGGRRHGAPDHGPA